MNSLPHQLSSKIKVNQETGCWEWQAAKRKYGYGVVMFRGRCLSSHRVVYELIRGYLPNELDHLCRNPPCCNPDHLEGVAHQENVIRGDAGNIQKAIFAQRTECINGHPLVPSNIYLYKMKKGYVRRMCRQCRLESKRRRRANGAVD